MMINFPIMINVPSNPVILGCEYPSNCETLATRFAMIHTPQSGSEMECNIPHGLLTNKCFAGKKFDAFRRLSPTSIIQECCNKWLIQ